MEKRNRDLTGRQFGRWTVLERDMENPSREDYYVCRCDCGTVRAVAEKNLVSGRSKSCGCSREKRASVDRRKDLLGKRFGKLTVVELLPEGKCRCVCDCGNEKIMNAASLKQGTQSCGCLRFKPRDDLTGKRFGRLTVISYERREMWQGNACGKSKPHRGEDPLLRLPSRRETGRNKKNANSLVVKKKLLTYPQQN